MTQKVVPQVAPHFTLPTARFISLHDLGAQGPVILVFYDARGAEF